jgi:glycosyltransferase involved in cell wall biosynthesis
MARFSVVVPLYNKEDYVSRTVRSIFAQTFRDYELIVIDDGSTDGSLEVVQKETEGHMECRVVRQDNAGVAVARNHGAQLARGEYICFLDSDDWWEPSFLEEMDRLITSCACAGIYASGFYLVKNGKKRVAPIGVSSDFEQGYINYYQTYAKTLCMPVTSSSVALPRAVFQASGGFKKGLAMGEDFDLWVRIALEHPVALVNRPLSNYFQDLPPRRRATRRLHKPESHMLWNLDYLAEEEAHNADLKLLMDRLRADGLYRFYLSRQYHAEALVQLAKIDWTNVSHSIYKFYHSPLWWQRLRWEFRTRAAGLKDIIKRTL